ncbi:MAG: hypothetical protein HYT36_01140 [Candidatus Staskawiczbacteria bacterium]|nr:hypothetical protein [Candidatus Staskawiczbacteria bacterium]
MGWCVSCYKQWLKLGPGRYKVPAEEQCEAEEAEWKEPRELYGRRPFDGRAPNESSEE